MSSAESRGDSYRGSYQLERAIEDPTYENTFRRAHLNQWTSQKTRFLRMDDWRKCVGSLADLDGRSFWGGLDLSSTIDLTAWVKVFPDEDGNYDVVADFWIPEDRVDVLSKQDRVPYRQWIRDGWVRITPGAAVDYDFIILQIAERKIFFKYCQ